MTNTSALRGGVIVSPNPARPFKNRVARRPSQGATHVGRGGTGNVFNPEEIRAAEGDQAKDGSAAADDDDAEDGAAAAGGSGANADPEPFKDQPGWAEKSKQFLFGKR